MMSSVFRLLAGLLVAAAFARAATPATQVADLPANVQRVVFLGDSITYGGGYVTAVAAYFATRHPDRAIEFINIGLSSEMVSGLSEEGHAGGKFPRPDLHERLGRVLAQTKPDLVFACYGMNDGIYLPQAEERFAKFQEGIRWLHHAVVAAGAQIIHLTPPVYDELRGGKVGYAAVLDAYADWLVTQRRVAKWEVIDLHGPMREYFEAHRRQDPQFFLAKDGVHPAEAGHWLMARAILVGLGARDLEGADSAAAMVAGTAHGAEILTLVARRQALLRDAWLTATGHRRPGVKAGLPLPEAQREAMEIDRQIARLR
jgi:lysophospholipase L1-like esterase